MKKVILYLMLATTLLAGELVDGKYSVTEKVLFGKKWRRVLSIDVKNHEIANISYDKITKKGEKVSENPKELKKIMKEADGINPYEELPKRYMKKREKNSNPNLDNVDTIAGASVSTSKFNKMMLFLIKKAEKGETGEYSGWFE